MVSVSRLVVQKKLNKHCNQMRPWSQPLLILLISATCQLTIGVSPMTYDLNVNPAGLCCPGGT